MLVTGASSGIGLETAKALLRSKATVVYAARNNNGMPSLRNSLHRHQSDQMVFIRELDLAVPDSIHAFSEAFKKQFDRLDALVNNAGIMNVPYAQTAFGVESQFAVNHLGHFMLTGLLLRNLLNTEGSRVVTVASLSAHDAVFDLDSIDSATVHPVAHYKMSKLANLLFAAELQRKLKQHGSRCVSVAAHPGYARTRLQRHTQGWLRKLHNRYTALRYAQPAAMGALPIIRAATEEHTEEQPYAYPCSANGLKGLPVWGAYPAAAQNSEQAATLWTLSEKLTGVNYPFA